jgi:RNA polymerase sigma factor (sigma-70 family)
MADHPMNDVLRQLRIAVVQDGGGASDSELLERFVRRRDEAAVAALVRRHGPMVWGVCRRIVRGYHDAEDAFQTTFLVLARKADSVWPREMLANWLYGVAHQTALNVRAAAARRRALERQVEPMPEPTAEPSLWHELRPVLDQELSRLPDKYRVAIVLCDLEGRTRKDVARQLGLSEGTLSGHLTRGRSMLARRLTRQGILLSAGTLAAMLARQRAAACVPTLLISSTIEATVSVAAGRPAANQSTSPTKKGPQTMLLTRRKTLTILAGALALLVGGPGSSAYRGFAQQPADEGKKAPAEQAARRPRGKDDAKPAAKDDVRKPGAFYCWLVFGPEKKVRALVRLDGDEVAIDRDGDGRFDSKGERFESEKDCKNVTIANPGGMTSYVVTFVEAFKLVPPEKVLEFGVHVRGDRDYFQGGDVQMAESPDGAPEAHFDGPLTVSPQTFRIQNRAVRLFQNGLLDANALLPQWLTQLAGKQLYVEPELPASLKRGNEPTLLVAGVATSGDRSIVALLSADTEAARREKSTFPAGVHPVVDVEFPAKKPGDPPIKRSYPLTDHLFDSVFRGPVRVPDEAGSGLAKVTFSLDGWKAAKVASSSYEIQVQDPPKEKTK